MSDVLPTGYTLLAWIAYPELASGSGYKVDFGRVSSYDKIVMVFQSNSTSTNDVFLASSGGDWTGYSGSSVFRSQQLNGMVVTPNLSATEKGDGTIHTLTMTYTSGFGNVAFMPYGGAWSVTKKLYRLSVYKSGVLIKDGVPAMRDDDGNVGLYDVVNSVFIPNTGSGVFLYEKATPPTPTDTTKYLIRAGEMLYTVQDGALTELSETTPTAALFTEYGVDDLPSSDILKTIVNPAVLKWTGAEEIEPMTATVTGEPYPQTLEALVDMTSESIVGVGSLTVNYSGEVRVRYSVDEKTSYTAEMTMADFLNTDKAALFAATGATRRLWLAFALYAGAKLTDFQIKFKN